MRFLSPTILVTFLVVGCAGTTTHDERLEGVWISDREMTLSKINSTRLSEKQLAFLRQNLGELRFAFSGGRTAVLFSSDPDAPVKYERYSVLESTPTSVTIKTSRVEEATYHFVDGCFYLVNEDWGYREYFCRHEPVTYNNALKDDAATPRTLA